MFSTESLLQRSPLGQHPYMWQSWECRSTGMKEWLLLGKHRKGDKEPRVTTDIGYNMGSLTGWTIGGKLLLSVPQIPCLYNGENCLTENFWGSNEIFPMETCLMVFKNEMFKNDVIPLWWFVVWSSSMKLMIFVPKVSWQHFLGGCGFCLLIVVF